MLLMIFPLMLSYEVKISPIDYAIDNLSTNVIFGPITISIVCRACDECNKINFLQVHG
jgi:hypothetical protein